VQANRVSQVAEDVFCVRGTNVNWYLLRDGRDLTLVDAGYPGDAASVEASVGLIGRQPEDVRAILVTHAHVDHLGAVARFHTRYGTPVYCDPVEVAHARRDYLEQVPVRTVVAAAWRPGVLAWAVRAARSGGTSDLRVPQARPFPTHGPLDLPGHPVPVPTHGHTSGHTAFHLPGAGAVLTGDALVTGHPTSRRTGPQRLPAMFDHDRQRSWLALDRLGELAGDLVLPGHGQPWSGPISDAIGIARTAEESRQRTGRRALA
jgi:glyoxylase-like metal-dependent hydrolase (beta-lactamase superfamily II)